MVLLRSGSAARFRLSGGWPFFQKLQYRLGKNTVTVSRDHMAGLFQNDITCLWY